MIVVAIIGILTTLALSFVRGAVMRAHIADGIYTVAPLKTMIHESLALDEAANACVGIRDITSPVGALASAVCTDDGTVANVRVVMDERAGNVVMDFVNDRTASAMWVCVGDMTTEGARYMPAGCRN
jgi:Tfp pilus assembly major pilin PilA